jgi:hypothetical protein
MKSMRKFLLLLLLAIPALEAAAQFPFSPFPYFGEPRPRFGLVTENIPSPSSDESPEAAYNFCVDTVVSTLIRFDDFLVASTASILPTSPIAPAEIPRAFPEPPALKHSSTMYYLKSNRCIRGYQAVYETPDGSSTSKRVDFHTVEVKMPAFQHLYAALTKCEQLFGHEQLAGHALCIRSIAEHLDR